EVMILVENIDDLEGDVKDLDKEKKGKKEDVDKLNDKIKNREKELEKLESAIVKKKEDPVNIGAGHFEFGKDIPPGRYEAFPEGRGSNFVVYSSGGGLEVNTILGSHGVESFVFEAGEGYTVESNAAAKL